MKAHRYTHLRWNIASYWLSLLCVAFVCGEAEAQKLLSARGFVSDGRSIPIRRTEIHIHNGPGSTTTDSGDFTIKDLPAHIKVGSPVTFLVKGWIIDDPYVGSRGRTYLPDPGSESLKIVVRKEGDQAFLSPLSIEKM